jgi:hypothetical protein
MKSSPSQEAEDHRFRLWVEGLPKTHWARYDLSACKLGWNAAVEQQALAFSFEDHCALMDAKHPQWRKVAGSATSYTAVAKEFWDAALASVELQSRAAVGICKCGHAEKQHQRYTDHDECTADECECNEFMVQSRAAQPQDARESIELCALAAKLSKKWMPEEPASLRINCQAAILSALSQQPRAAQPQEWTSDHVLKLVEAERVTGMSAIQELRKACAEHYCDAHGVFWRGDAECPCCVKLARAAQPQEWKMVEWGGKTGNQDSWDIICGDKTIVCDLKYREAKAIVVAHNASLK